MRKRWRVRLGRDLVMQKFSLQARVRKSGAELNCKFWVDASIGAEICDVNSSSQHVPTWVSHVTHVSSRAFWDENL